MESFTNIYNEYVLLPQFTSKLFFKVMDLRSVSVTDMLEKAKTFVNRTGKVEFNISEQNAGLILKSMIEVLQVIFKNTVDVKTLNSRINVSKYTVMKYKIVLKNPKTKEKYVDAEQFMVLIKALRFATVYTLLTRSKTSKVYNLPFINNGIVNVVGADYSSYSTYNYIEINVNIAAAFIIMDFMLKLYGDYITIVSAIPLNDYKMKIKLKVK